MPDQDDFSSVPVQDRDTLSMSVTVDISDMDTHSKQIFEELASIYEDNFMEIVEKNRDYQWSFLTTGEKLSMSDGVPFDNAARAQAFGLLTRSGDKRERLIENIYGDGDANVSDSPATTAREAANYYLFLSLVLDNPELTQVLHDE